MRSNEQIGDVAVKFIANQFREDNFGNEDDMLENIPRRISEEENEEIIRLSEQKEVRRVVFELSENNACSPDGFSGNFF